MDDRAPTPATRDAADVLAALETELAQGQRRRALGMLLASLMVTGPLASLWLTEPELPLRTHLVFGGLVMVGLAWIGLGAYLLVQRHPLYAHDRVLATGLAVAASAITGVASTVVSVLRSGTVAAVATTAIAALMVIAACALHLQARRRRRVLTRRRHELEAGVAG